MTSEPVRPLPAATLVPLRDGESGLEVLLLLRSERSSFVPGCYVFPGGMVDDADASADATALLDGLDDRTVERLGAPGSHPPGTAYLVCAVRETFEESGLLVGVRDAEGAAPSCAHHRVAALRSDLLTGRIGFSEALRRLDARIAAGELTYFARWITPEISPRRYDTRFFAARVEDDGSAVGPILDEREMTHALWTTPQAALRAREAGSMKLILPTVATLERLATLPDARGAVSALGQDVIATKLPGVDASSAETKGFAARSARDRLAEP